MLRCNIALHIEYQGLVTLVVSNLANNRRHLTTYVLKRLKWHIFIPNASAAFLIENMKNKNIIISNSYMIITAADRGINHLVMKWGICIKGCFLFIAKAGAFVSLEGCKYQSVHLYPKNAQRILIVQVWKIKIHS